jgi:PIN domain nuclease of toxin-antitoxin system
VTNLLVDTHVLLWALDETDRLRDETRNALVDPDNEVFVSAATPWEMSIKASIGKLRTPSDLAYQLQRMRFTPLAVTLEDAVAVRDLPMIHRDPFDRMLIAQAQSRGFTLVTNDNQIEQYEVRTISA